MELSCERGVLYVLQFAAGGYLRILRRGIQKQLRLAGGRFLRKPLLHVIGDSHSWSLRDCSGAVIHNIGPATAYNLINPNSTGQYGRKLFDIVRRIDRRKDTVMLVFGEIDCRVHIYHHFMKSGGTVTMGDLMNRTVNHYGAVMERLKSEGVHFCVCGIVPATGHVIRYPIYATAVMRRRMCQDFARHYPYQAPPETRSIINREFNAKLKRYCLQHGYRYFDIYSHTADARGFIKDEYREDEIHLNSRAGKILRQWLAEDRARSGTLMSRL
jgi:hypothetical protein